MCKRSAPAGATLISRLADVERGYQAALKGRAYGLLAGATTAGRTTPRHSPKPTRA